MEAATRWMTIDLRTLAVFRITLAVTLLVDLADRATSIALYTDRGPAPLSLLAEEGAVLSLYTLSGDTGFVAALFVVNALVAVGLLLGVRPRTMAVLALVLQLSVHERTFSTAYAGDNLLRVLLFWSCWLPIGARISLPTRWDRAPGTARSAATAGLVLCAFAIFFFTGVEKAGSPAWRDGSALTLYLSTWIHPTALGKYLVEGLPQILPFFTLAALALELAGPFLLLAPWWRVRLATAVAFAALMFGIGLTIDAGLFPLVTLTALVPLLPVELWPRASAAATSPAPRSLPPLANRVAIACVVVMMASNVWNTAGVEAPKLASDALRVFGLDQRWPMFHRPQAAPQGWLHITGTTASGPIDLLTGARADPTIEPPPMATHFSFRERQAIRRAFLGPLGWGEHTARWLCSRAPVPIQTISVGLAEVRGEPPAVLVIEIVKDLPCP